MAKRRRVRCWVCGWTTRRVPRPVWMSYSHVPKGRLAVIGRCRTVVIYGWCKPCEDLAERVGTEPTVMLLPRDARYVLRAALKHEHGGHNRRSEYD